MSTTEATAVEVGTPVRFTASRLGLVADLTASHFIDEVASEGDVGTYAGAHPNAELAERDWHLVKVARLEATAGQGVTIYAEGNEVYCPCHRAQFELIEEEPDPARVEVVRGLRALADLLEGNEALPVPSWVIAQRSAYTEPIQREQFIEVCRILGVAAVVDGQYVFARTELAGSVAYKVEAKAHDICVEREVTEKRFVLPEEIQLRVKGGDAA